MKRSGNLVMIFFGLFWTAMVLLFDGVVGYEVINQLRAEHFAATTGEIIQSKATGQEYSESPSSGVTIRYRYTVNAKTYESSRFRYGQDSSSDSPLAYESANGHPVGSQIIVFYDPRNPAESLLSPGLNGGEFMWLVFLTPFNMIMLGLWAACVAMLYAKIRNSPIADFKIIQDLPRTRVRLPRLPAIASGLGTTGIIAFIETFLLAFTSGGFNPNSSLAKLALVFAYGAGFLVFSWQWRKIRSGAEDLVINDSTRTVQLPQTFGRKERVELMFSEITDVIVKTVVQKSRRSDPSCVYAPILQIKGKDADAGKLAEWTSQANAEKFAGWLRSQLGKPGGDGALASSAPRSAAQREA